MSNSKTIWVSGALLAALAAGCGSNNQTNSDRQTNSYSQLRQEELEAAREVYISDRRKQLDELDTQIARMETRLEHEGQYADAQERAEWSQRLFELREQQRRTRAELDRAETASPEEWAEMRGTIGNAVDSVEAGVKKLASDMGSLFSSNDSNDATASPGGSRDIDLCDLRVEGTQAELTEHDQRLVVRLTASDERAVENLRTRAEQLKEEHDPGSNLVDNVSVEEDRDGVRVIFTPAPGQRTALRQQLSNEVEQIQNQRC
jgi:hypothetical protein